MYKIEKYLLDNGLKLKRSYITSGVLVYSYYDEEGFYGDEVVLFPNHKPNPCWEINVYYPYSICIPSYREIGKDFIKNCKQNLEEAIKTNIEFNKDLLNINNPWEVIEDGKLGETLKDN